MRAFRLICCVVPLVVVSSTLAGQPWAFTPPRKPALPKVSTPTHTVNPIDAFVLARLEAKQLTFNTPADRLTLLRRVTYDLTGLAPTLTEQQAFLDDTSPQA